MVQENVPNSVATDDNLLILWVPTLTTPGAPKLTELSAVGVQKLTYSLTTGGWTPSQTQDTIADERLSLGQSLERPGRKKKSLAVQYVFGDEDDVAATTLIEGTSGFIVVRSAVPNEDALAIGDLLTVWPIKCGEQMEDPAAANAVFTMKQMLFVTGRVFLRVPAVA